jgi:hypothetical protein
MNKKIYILLLILSSLMSAQIERTNFYKEQKNSAFEIFEADLKSSFNVSLELLQSPIHFDNNDLIMLGIVTTATAASFSIDNKIRNGMINSRNRPMDKITNISEKFGRPFYGTILSGLLYGSGLVFSDNYTRKTGQMLAEAILINGLYTQLLKVTFGRARPFTGEGKSEIDLFEFEFESEDNSFPSGHSSTAFAIATVLSERIENIYASIALYSLASLTAYQRVYSDVHWFSDTLMGAALGTLIGLKIVRLNENNPEKDSAYNLNFFPKITPYNYEVGFSLHF